MPDGILHSAAGRPRSQGHELDAAHLVATLCYLFGIEEMSISELDRLIERRPGEGGRHYLAALLKLAFNLCIVDDFDYKRALREGLPYVQQYDQRHGLNPTMATPSEYNAWAVDALEREARIQQSGPGICQYQIVDTLTSEHLAFLLQQGPVIVCVDWDPQTSTHLLALAYIFNHSLHVYEPSMGDYVTSVDALWQRRSLGSKLVLVRR